MIVEGLVLLTVKTSLSCQCLLKLLGKTIPDPVSGRSIFRLFLRVGGGCYHGDVVRPSEKSQWTESEVWRCCSGRRQRCLERVCCAMTVWLLDFWCRTLHGRNTKAVEPRPSSLWLPLNLSNGCKWLGMQVCGVFFLQRKYQHNTFEMAFSHFFFLWQGVFASGIMAPC